MVKKLIIITLAIIFSLLIGICNAYSEKVIFSGLESLIIPMFEEETQQWEPIGECRVTTYCPYCNSPQGHGSASGVYLEYGHVACSWLPIGTVIRIDGEVFTVVDVCGTDAIDIFMPFEDGCHCDINEYRFVEVLVN